MATAPTPEDIAGELRWRLSNCNSDLLDDVDIAYNTGEIPGQPHAFRMYVDWSSVLGAQRGHLALRVTVEREDED